MAVYLGGSLVLRGAQVRDPGCFLVVWGGGIFIQSLVPWCAVRRHVRLRGPRDRALERELFVEMAPLGISSAIAVAYFRLDANFLKHYRDDAAVGRFQHVFQLLSFSINVPSNLTAALVPTLVRAAHQSTAEVVRITRRVGAVLAGLALPFAAMAFSWSPQVLWLLWVRDFSGRTDAATFEAWSAAHGDEVACARLLALAAIAIFVTYPQMTALMALARQRRLAVISAGALVAKAALSLFTVDAYGVVGAAATTLAIEVAVCLVSGAMLWNVVRGAVFSRQLLRPLLPALAIAAAAWFLRDLAPLAVAPTALAFAAAAIWLGGALPLKLGAVA
jgi:O-antigen/teichoic acid export membrane protein